MQYYTSYPYLVQTNIHNKEQSLVISTDYTVTNNFCTMPCFHGSKSMLRWHNLHKGDVLLLKIPTEGAQPGGCAGSPAGSALMVTSPSPLTDDKVRKAQVGQEFLIALEGVWMC